MEAVAIVALGLAGAAFTVAVVAYIGASKAAKRSRETECFTMRLTEFCLSVDETNRVHREWVESSLDLQDAHINLLTLQREQDRDNKPEDTENE
jgi:hypothetical protein